MNPPIFCRAAFAEAERSIVKSTVGPCGLVVDFLQLSRKEDPRVIPANTSAEVLKNSFLFMVPGLKLFFKRTMIKFISRLNNHIIPELLETVFDYGFSLIIDIFQ